MHQVEVIILSQEPRRSQHPTAELSPAAAGMRGTCSHDRAYMPMVEITPATTGTTGTCSHGRAYTPTAELLLSVIGPRVTCSRNGAHTVSNTSQRDLLPQEHTWFISFVSGGDTSKSKSEL